MTPLVQHFMLTVAAILLMAGLSRVVLHDGFCLHCGGHGKHRDDCPIRDDDES